jgi:hypothetical protein
MRHAWGVLIAASILLVCASAAHAEESVTPLPTLAAAPATPAPLLARPEAAPPSGPSGHVPIARRWWFWAGLGAAAVAAVVAAIAISPREAYMGNTSPGVVPVF